MLTYEQITKLLFEGFRTITNSDHFEISVLMFFCPYEFHGMDWGSQAKQIMYFMTGLGNFC